MATSGNSTYYATVYRMAQEVGIQPPTSEAQFDDDNQLPSPLLKLKKYTDKVQRMLIRTLNKTFTRRIFTFNTTQGTTTYELDAQTNIEGVGYHSVRCNTTGAAIPLWNLPYNEYREMWTDETTVPQGKPQRWVAVITPISEGVNRISSMLILPTPDANHTIEYEAKITARPLLAHDSVILFPPEYEDVLWTWGEAMLESKLGVDATMADYAQMVIDHCRMWSERPIDEKRGVKMGVQISSRNDVGGNNYDNSNFTRGW